MENLQMINMLDFLFDMLEHYPDFPNYSEAKQLSVLTKHINYQDGHTKLNLQYDYIGEASDDYYKVIFDMSDFGEVFKYADEEVLSEIKSSEEFKSNNKYFMFNGKGVVSNDDITVLGFDSKKIAQYILEEYHNFIC
jgi:hypothetical protein